jgi:hypothetical protein
LVALLSRIHRWWSHGSPFSPIWTKVRSSFSSTGSHGGSSTTPSPISPPITSPDGGATVSGTDSPSTGVRAEVVVGGVVVIEALTGTIRARPYPPELRYVGLLLLLLLGFLQQSVARWPFFPQFRHQIGSPSGEICLASSLSLPHDLFYFLSSFPLPDPPPLSEFL